MDKEAKNLAMKVKHPFLTTLGVLLVFLLVVLLVAFVLPPVVLRYTFSRIEKETGTAITFEKAYFYLADGSFLYVKGLAVKRQNHHSMNFDLHAESVRMPAMIPADFYSPVLGITGLQGTIERMGSDPVNEGEQQEKTTSDTTFINILVLVDSEVEFIDRTLETPFRATVQIENFVVGTTEEASLFTPYFCEGKGHIGSAKFEIIHHPDKLNPTIEVAGIPLAVLAPYAPVLDDVFDSGSLNIQVDDISDKTQKRVRVSLTLQPNCTIKSVNDILAPTLQTALRQLDQSSASDLQDLRGKIERLKTAAESVRGKMDEVAQIVDRLSFLAPRDVREEYEKFKSQYDKAKAGHEEWSTKLGTLEQELDYVKIRIVEDTFKTFINAGIPIEMELQEVDGKWQYDGYAVVIGLIKKNYQTVIAAQYQKRIQDIREAVERLLVL